MSGTLHVFTGTAVAHEVVSRRPGARHALLVMIEGPSIAEAQANARSLAEACGWTHISFTTGGLAAVEPDKLPRGVARSAYEVALKRGKAIVSYDDELGPNA
jgi:hypothetical protein